MDTEEQMSLDVYLSRMQETGVYSRNITHNLGTMAELAGIYKYLWRPDELMIVHAGQLIEPLTKGLKWLEENEDKAREESPENGWGNYETLVMFVKTYLEACIEFPDANVRAHR